MITITSTKRDGQFWVEIVMDGQKMQPHGPFDADEAEAMMNQFAGVCAVLHQPCEQHPRRPADDQATGSSPG